MKKRWSIPLLLGGVACLGVRVFFAPEIYKADCKCAMAERKDSIVTNETGDVVQPLERMLQQGTYKACEKKELRMEVLQPPRLSKNE